MKRIVVAALLGSTLSLLGARPSASQPAPDPIDDLEVTVAPASADVVLGESLELSVTVANNSQLAGEGLVAHLDVTDPAEGGSVDPEDWTSTLSRPLDGMAPGEATTVVWDVQPISAGRFSLYAVVLRKGSTELAASNVVAIGVEDQRSLNPDGILPVALGVPLVIGGLLVVQIGYRRRQWRTG